MKRNIVRTLCTLLIAVLLMGCATTALAAKEIPSKGIKLPTVVTPEPAKDHSDRKVVLHSDHEKGCSVTLGEEITLTAELIGYEDASSLTITWQYSPDGKEYYDLDAHGESYTFAVGYENAGYRWRAQVTGEFED